MSFESESLTKTPAAPAECPHSKLLEETMSLADNKVPGTSGNNKDYVDKMSTVVADALDKSFNGDSKPAQVLSDALKPLSGSDRNDLLMESKEKNDAFAKNVVGTSRADSMKHLLLDKWDAKTSTWDNVTVADSNYPLSAPFRIVQPGNTLASLASDRLTQLYDYTHHMGEPDEAGIHRPWDWKYSPGDVSVTMMKIAEKNGLGDPNKQALDLKVGDAIKLPGMSIQLEQ